MLNNRETSHYPEINMERIVSAAYAARRFSYLLRRVRAGESFLVTSNGDPIAKILPVSEDNAVRKTAKTVLLQRLRAQSVATDED